MVSSWFHHSFISFQDVFKLSPPHLDVTVVRKGIMVTISIFFIIFCHIFRCQNVGFFTVQHKVVLGGAWLTVFSCLFLGVAFAAYKAR